MAQTLTDFKQLSKAILKKDVPQKPGEVKPEPRRSVDDGAEVLAYFSRSPQDAQKRPTADSSDETANGRRIAELEAAVAAKDAALDALAEDKANIEVIIARLESELQKERKAHEAAARDRDRLQGECGRLYGELRKAAENRPVCAQPANGAVAQAEHPCSHRFAAQATPSGDIPKPARGLLAAPGAMDEAFPGEVREMVVAVLRDALDSAAQSGRERRAEVLKNVLAANPTTGGLERRRAELKQILKDAGYFNDPKPLEKLGMRLISGRTHWKLQYANVRIVMSKTPSDYRASLNNATEVANRCF